MAKKKPAPAIPKVKKTQRTSRDLKAVQKQLRTELAESCLEVANRKGVNLFEYLLNFVTNDFEALGYVGKRTIVTPDGGVFVEDWISPEMRFAATKEAIKYVAPQLKAIAIVAPPTGPEGDDGRPKRQLTRQDLVDAIKADPFFQLAAHEVVDVTNTADEPEERTRLSDPFEA